MPRALSKYTVREWLRLRPLVDRKNHARYQVRERIALARHASPVALPRLRGRKVLITISFNDPEVIEWQTRLIARNVPEVIHIIADNSTKLMARDAIRNICAAADVAFVAVPANPWVGREKEGGKSHGYALNWAWKNIVLANRPSMVGFLDHDIFPTAKTDPFRMLDQATVAGLVRTAPEERWYLWPGFAFFNLERLRTDRLNFGRDWLDGFDTGGLNWRCLYRALSKEDLCAADYERIAVAAGVAMDEAIFERIDGWLHESRFTTDIDLAPARRQQLIELKRRRVLDSLMALPA
ncbi:hypothetical protein EN828_30300 [Mesorhizobium sp. M2D.F.Ca.ET.185.01.1.1]|uniref:hypothetical protein n=1 Tax=unclassified Mesorhizobium TaxID=325217 RepID=UPI000FCACB5E|nr:MULTISPECIES: hypothetical protein [unclassified Mesorhizobium]TGP51302.1 hypothetical protein EN873_21865 [bacterium M00.F.Ca.ET.230.01.1.1]TGP73417.1 hypothetical protein EN870_29950 [bacterium M00.F.Ca.ET.227.01.1.1]TGP84426.1 hypothetical protein EN864_30695 [bacterium M00.F.Ca.ET.221.01.1.1]TGP87040.1 hypothetical protein EN865_30060 [bacterium M00.F.Ca.ET.222.01.1.1]TGT72674.1 hypothetical protein EN802_17150 [bacterium M00.F.Ca.ET.159.01.1.1]TGT85843.1 hypothetical protein EN800_115